MSLSHTRLPQQWLIKIHMKVSLLISRERGANKALHHSPLLSRKPLLLLPPLCF